MDEKVERVREEHVKVVDSLVADIARAIREKHAEAMRSIESLWERAEDVQEKTARVEALGVRMDMAEARLKRVTQRWYEISSLEGGRGRGGGRGGGGGGGGGGEHLEGGIGNGNGNAANALVAEFVGLGMGQNVVSGHDDGVSQTLTHQHHHHHTTAVHRGRGSGANPNPNPNPHPNPNPNHNPDRNRNRNPNPNPGTSGYGLSERERIQIDLSGVGLQTILNRMGRGGVWDGSRP